MSDAHILDESQISTLPDMMADMYRKAQAAHEHCQGPWQYIGLHDDEGHIVVDSDSEGVCAVYEWSYAPTESMRKNTLANGEHIAASNPLAVMQTIAYAYWGVQTVGWGKAMAALEQAMSEHKSASE